MHLGISSNIIKYCLRDFIIDNKTGSLSVTMPSPPKERVIMLKLDQIMKC